MMQDKVRKSFIKYDTRRKKAQLHIPGAFMFVLMSYVLHELCQRYAMTADGKLTTNEHTLADLDMNNRFFRICERLTVIALAGYLMRSVKMPGNKCFQNLIIFVFVATRILITIWGLLIVDNIFKLIMLCVKSTWKEDADPKLEVKNDS